MGILPVPRKLSVPSRSALRALAFVALAGLVLFGATWAKISRYDERALPSPHFSTSVKIVRVLFHDGPCDGPQALIAANARLPEPDWNGLAPFPEAAAASGNPPLPFQALRAPPAAA
jgi:hypothetical protein